MSGLLEEEFNNGKKLERQRMRKRRSGRERRAEIINKISNSGDSKRGERPLFFCGKNRMWKVIRRKRTEREVSKRIKS